MGEEEGREVGRERERKGGKLRERERKGGRWGEREEGREVGRERGREGGEGSNVWWVLLLIQLHDLIALQTEEVTHVHM